MSTDFAVLRPGKDLGERYLWRLLQSPEFVDSVVSHSQGIGYPAISPTELAALPVWVPPIDEQRLIATLLDRETSKIDALIAKKQRLIEQLQEKRTALISHAVTKGVEPDVPMKDSGVEWLGQIPAHWRIAKFKRTAFFQEGPGLRNWQFTESGIRVICVTNITESGIDFSSYEKFISSEEYESTYRQFTVACGDLLLSSSGNSWGKIAECSISEPMILNTSTIRINENRSRDLLKSLMKWTLQSDGTREQLRLMMTGSCQPNFGPSHLSRVIVPVPPQDEQNRLVNWLEERTQKIGTLMATVREGIDRLREYRNALISAAVTGKFDLRGEVE